MNYRLIINSKVLKPNFKILYPLLLGSNHFKTILSIKSNRKGHIANREAGAKVEVIIQTIPKGQKLASIATEASKDKSSTRCMEVRIRQERISLQGLVIRQIGVKVKTKVKRKFQSIHAHKSQIWASIVAKANKNKFIMKCMGIRSSHPAMRRRSTTNFTDTKSNRMPMRKGKQGALIRSQRAMNSKIR